MHLELNTVIYHSNYKLYDTKYVKIHILSIFHSHSHFSEYFMSMYVFLNYLHFLLLPTFQNVP